MWCVMGGGDGDQLGELNQINGFSNASEKCTNAHFMRNKWYNYKLSKNTGKPFFSREKFK